MCIVGVFYLRDSMIPASTPDEPLMLQYIDLVTLFVGSQFSRSASEGMN